MSPPGGGGRGAFSGKKKKAQLRARRLRAGEETSTARSDAPPMRRLKTELHRENEVDVQVRKLDSMFVKFALKLMQFLKFVRIYPSYVGDMMIPEKLSNKNRNSIIGCPTGRPAGCLSPIEVL